MKFRNLISGIVFVILLFWGPINHSWPGEIFVRIGYLIIIPNVVWWLLKLLWNYWKPTDKEEDIADKIGAAIICLGLWTIAVIEAISKTHIGNTHWIQTREGSEAVGDDVVLSGPDWGFVFMLCLISVCFLWYGIIMKKPVSKD